jgi:hypothetical protein
MPQDLIETAQPSEEEENSSDGTADPRAVCSEETNEQNIHRQLAVVPIGSGNVSREDQSVESPMRRIQEVEVRTKSVVQSVKILAEEFPRVSDPPSTETYPDIPRGEEFIPNMPESEEDIFVPSPKVVKSYEDGQLPICPPDVSRIPSQDTDLSTHPHPESVPAYQGTAQDLRIHATTQARRWILTRAFSIFTFSPILLLLGLTPTGVAAAPIWNHHGSSPRAVTAGLHFAPNGIVLTSLASLIFTIRMRVADDRYQRGISAVSLWVTLITLLPLSAFALQDIHLLSR